MQPTDSRVVNLAAYRFVTLDRLEERRHQLFELCRQLELRGTILLSPEGVNLSVAGSERATDELLHRLNEDEALADPDVKRSLSARQPFGRMLVKIKREIIAFGIPGIDPERAAAPKLSPAQLKCWLDECREMTLLDVRNQYEAQHGTFVGAHEMRLARFRQFPMAARRLPDGLRDRPLVVFCTGGIRCEKAGPYLQQLGFPKTYQLDGGILRYFEECGDAHFQGECFVFDERVAVDARSVVRQLPR